MQARLRVEHTFAAKAEVTGRNLVAELAPLLGIHCFGFLGCQHLLVLVHFFVGLLGFHNVRNVIARLREVVVAGDDGCRLLDLSEEGGGNFNLR